MKNKLTFNKCCMMIIMAAMTATMNAQDCDLLVSVSSTDPTCFSATGSITLNVTGTSTYRYQIDGGALALMYSSSVTVSNLTAGLHTWRVIDGEGCYAEGTKELFNPDNPTFSVKVSDIQKADCSGTGGGSFTINITGTGVSYLWSLDGGVSYTPMTGTSHTFTNMASGTYDLMVKDISGCTHEYQSVRIDKMTDAVVSVSSIDVVSHPTCATTGSIQVNVTGGGNDAANYRYSVNGGAYTAYTNGLITGLSAGTYRVSVMDINYPSCPPALSEAVVLTQQMQPVLELDVVGNAHSFGTIDYGYGAQTPLTVTVTNNDCQPTGELTISVNSGNYTLSTTTVSNIAAGGNTTFTVVPNTGLIAGSYNASVTVRGGGYTPQGFNVNFTVNKKQLTITDPTLTREKEYDGNATAAVTANALLNVVTGDNVNVFAVATYDDKNVRTNKTITVVYSIIGADIGNYTKPADYAVTNGVITAKSITVTALGGQSTYGNSPSNPGISAEGLVNGESVYVLTGLSNDFYINATTAPGSYLLKVIGDLTNENYTITKRYEGIWRASKIAGAAVSGVPTLANIPSEIEIVISPVTIPINQGNQTVEYAISTSVYAGGILETLEWQSGTTFTGPFSEGVIYYIYARSTANEYYAAGTAQTSDAIIIQSPTGIDNVQPAKTLVAWMQNNRLYASGLMPGKLWSVYNISGVLVYQDIAKSDKADISLPIRGVYIIRAGNEVVKIKN